MTYADLLKTIKTELKPLYLFTGEEGGIISIYMKQLATLHNLPFKKFYTAAEYLAYKNSAAGFFAQDKIVAAIIDDLSLVKDEAAWDKLLKTDDTVVLVFFKYDKRLKIFKHFENNLYEFSKLTAEQLTKYIINICGINHDNALLLADLCGRDYLQCINESEKIKALGGSPNGDFALLLNANQLGTRQDQNIFYFIDLFMQREELKVLERLRNMTSDDVMAVVSLLFRAFKNLLIVDSDSGKGICERTGITPWEIRNATAWRGNYTTTEILQALKFLQAVDEKIKFGKLDVDLALDYIFAGII